MARQPRLILPGQPHHVVQRGNNRCRIFFADRDYHFYLECVEDGLLRYGAEIHSYALMTNHVHLLLTPHAVESIGRILQSVGRRYVRYINTTYRRTGTLWEGRYRSTLIDSDNYLLACMRYIELNPVRAGMVQRPGDYRWSSYRANGGGETDRLVRPHPLYNALGTESERRLQVYRSLFASPVADETANALRESTNKGWVFGGDRFREHVEAILGRRAGPLPRGGRRY